MLKKLFQRLQNLISKKPTTLVEAIQERQRIKNKPLEEATEKAMKAVWERAGIPQLGVIVPNGVTNELITDSETGERRFKTIAESAAEQLAKINYNDGIVVEHMDFGIPPGELVVASEWTGVDARYDTHFEGGRTEKTNRFGWNEGDVVFHTPKETQELIRKIELKQEKLGSYTGKLKQEEIDYIIANYSTLGPNQIQRDLGRSETAVARVAKKHGLQPPKRTYTDDELLDMAYQVKLLVGEYPKERKGWNKAYLSAVEKVGLPRPNTYRDRFGSLEKAWELAEERARRLTSGEEQPTE